MEINEIIIGNKDIVPNLFTAIERALEKEINTQIYLDKRYVDELKRMDDYKEHNGSILFFEDWREGYHYYESYHDRKSILKHVEVYEESMHDIREPIFKATFVENSIDFCQLVSFSSAKIKDYCHYKVMVKEFLKINCIA